MAVCHGPFPFFRCPPSRFVSPFFFFGSNTSRLIFLCCWRALEDSPVLLSRLHRRFFFPRLLSLGPPHSSPLSRGRAVAEAFSLSKDCDQTPFWLSPRFVNPLSLRKPFPKDYFRRFLSRTAFFFCWMEATPPDELTRHCVWLPFK